MQTIYTVACTDFLIGACIKMPFQQGKSLCLSTYNSVRKDLLLALQKQRRFRASLSQIGASHSSKLVFGY